MYIHIHEIYVYICMYTYTPRCVYIHIYAGLCVLICVRIFCTYVYIHILHIYEMNVHVPLYLGISLKYPCCNVISNALNLCIHLRELEFIVFSFYHPRK